MTDLMLFGLALISFAVATYIYAQYKGGIKPKNLKDWGVVALIFVLAATLALAQRVSAKELDWNEARFFEYTEFYVGLEYQLRKDNPQCSPEGTDDRIISHVGITQHIMSYKNVELEAVFTHHSCAINDDLYVSDSIGPRLIYRVVW
jgi:hypothetical protein